MISDNSLIVAKKEQVSSALAGEAVILNLESGVYYGLNPVGASIWNLIQKSTSVREIRDAILEEYNVDFDQCDRDVKALLEQLQDQGMIEVQHETAA
ncbi:hypothetical protein Cri9333_4300 [Crinalium epipsammum PCC 9333]|uniref:Coenzyme PQQ synthesis protein D (PqqD) n=1 Tax=Crinalium epipsammum PCC 9333 TaxID=1173022 RepID=K9W4H4_9CYAN|nr:PqqD family protein [Crinalium epipsammum]AFZ15086.1 hypothetical protein Cri9333_4300 [Crinalium epipsammum PCC 9333]